MPVPDADHHGHVAGKRMRGPGKARIIHVQRHFNPVEQALGDFRTYSNQALHRLFGQHADGNVVIGGPHDEIDLLHNAAFIGHVIMR